jgi:hypothetical protein
MNNEEVAKKWLELKPEVEGAIYFDGDDNLMVIDRNNTKTKLNISPLKMKLEKCVIFLDDIHTRGTDLKFPINTKGVVTLGKSLTKDKLI